MNQRSLQIILSDGRKLAYAEYGKSDGYPIFYFHGSPASRLEPLILGEQVLERSGLRIIAPDRPGMGAPIFSPDVVSRIGPPM